MKYYVFLKPIKELPIFPSKEEFVTKAQQWHDEPARATITADSFADAILLVNQECPDRKQWNKDKTSWEGYSAFFYEVDDSNTLTKIIAEDCRRPATDLVERYIIFNAASSTFDDSDTVRNLLQNTSPTFYGNPVPTKADLTAATAEIRKIIKKIAEHKYWRYVAPTYYEYWSEPKG